MKSMHADNSVCRTHRKGIVIGAAAAATDGRRPIGLRARRILKKHLLIVLGLNFLLTVNFLNLPAHADDPKDDSSLTRYDEMPLPSAEELLTGKPFDEVVLLSEKVLLVAPISPRPDSIARLSFRQKQAEATYTRVRNYHRTQLLEAERQFSRDRSQSLEERRQIPEDLLAASKDRMQKATQAAAKLAVTVLDDTVDPDYVLDVQKIRFVVYYEDLILRRVEQLINEKQLPVAYDLMLLLNRRHLENNKRIQAELEADEKASAAELDALKAQREQLRTEQKQGNLGAKAAGEISSIIGPLSNEIKELETELATKRKALRFVRPNDYPRPAPPQLEDVLIPFWPKFEEVYAKLVLKDAESHERANDLEGALRLLGEIWTPERKFLGVVNPMARVVNQLIESLVERKQYRQARHFLYRLANYEPDHSVVKKWTDEWLALTAASMEMAKDASRRGDNVEAFEIIDRAARIWPETPGLKEVHRQLTEKCQIVRVGVLGLSKKTNGAPFETANEERARLLISIPTIFEPSRIPDQHVRYQSAYFDTWEPMDLGRHVRFQLNLKRASWESRPLITSSDIYADLSSRLDPKNARFDERLSGFVDGISVQSPSEFTLYFNRLPLRIESFWQMAISVQQDPFTAKPLTHQDPAPDLQRFSVVSETDRQTRYRRVREQPTSERLRFIDQIVEVKYDSWEKALQGLQRDEVTLLPLADLHDLKALQGDNQFVVLPYALPKSHFLVFQPKTAALHDGALRRALLHAIPREKILRDVVLIGAPESYARLVTAPFSSRLYGYNKQIEQPVYNPQLAATLAFTAKKHLGGTLPTLRISCPADFSSRSIVQAMIPHWKRVGLDVTLIDHSESSDDKSLDEWDLCYRTASFVEPIVDLWPLLTLQAGTGVEALQGLPERTRHSLLELERTTDWPTAVKRMHKLMADLLTETRYIPLWEVDEFLVARRNLYGLPAKPMHAYDNVEQWALQSWYPQDTP